MGMVNELLHNANELMSEAIDVEVERCAVLDSNQRPIDYESTALTTELTAPVKPTKTSGPYPPTGRIVARVKDF